MFNLSSRMLICMYMDMAMPMPMHLCAHLLSFRNIRDRMCLCES